MKKVEIQLGKQLKAVELGETKEVIIARLGMPDADGGNGCFTEWPDVMHYDAYELVFRAGKLVKLCDAGRLLLFSD